MKNSKLKKRNKEMNMSKIVLNKTKLFLRELWNNKVLSIFYLIVVGANLFNFSSDLFALTELWQKILVAISLPIAFVFLLTLIVIFVLEKFKQTKFVKIIKEATREFFQIFQEDNYEDNIKTVKLTLKQRAYYIAIDYWAVFVCIGVIAILNYLNRSFIEIVVLTAIYDFIVAWVFMIYSLKTGNDITFGEGYRRAITVIHRESKMMGYLGMIVLNLKATVWDGPEQVVIFFKKEIGGLGRMTIILMFLAAIQGLFWAWLYSYGYESVTDALGSLT